MSSRPLATLASLVLAVLGLVILLPDYACSRAGGLTERQVVEYASDPAYVVFSGEVVKVERIPESRYTATLRVFEVWKGPEQGTLQVNTLDPAFCGYHFREGQEYLVFAYESGPNLRVDAGATKSLRSSKAREDLVLLGEGKKPKSSGDALTDTSGVVPARATVGLACLAMAASFLLVVRLVRTG